MHILLIGASGHVGTALASHLAEHRVTGLVRHAPASPSYTPLVVPDWVDHPETVAEALAADPVDLVITAVGGWYIDVHVLQRGLAAFDADYSSYLRAHYSACVISEALAAARTETGEAVRRGVPRVSDPELPWAVWDERAARIVHIALNGVASEQPLAGSGAISVFGAAQTMLIDVAARESRMVKFRQVTILSPVSGDDRNDLSRGDGTVSIGSIATRIWEVVDSDAEHAQVTNHVAAGPNRRL